MNIFGIFRDLRHHFTSATRSKLIKMSVCLKKKIENSYLSLTLLTTAFLKVRKMPDRLNRGK